MSKFSLTLLASMAAVTVATSPAWTAELEPASGHVVLTVAGNIENTNRQPFDDFEDAFTNYHERTFENAAEFDHAMLEALGMHEFEVTYEAWPRPITLAGPRLQDVLDAVGATPESITALALDGFAVEVSSEDIGSEDWIVAIKLDGEYMALGQRGPAWVVFDPGEDGTITPEEEGIWPWAAFYIEVN